MSQKNSDATRSVLPLGGIVLNASQDNTISNFRDTIEYLADRQAYFDCWRQMFSNRLVHELGEHFATLYFEATRRNWSEKDLFNHLKSIVDQKHYRSTGNLDNLSVLANKIVCADVLAHLQGTEFLPRQLDDMLVLIKRQDLLEKVKKRDQLQDPVKPKEAPVLPKQIPDETPAYANQTSFMVKSE